MPDFVAHVMVCTNSENAEDQRHCGDKNGVEIRQKFNQLLSKITADARPMPEPPPVISATLPCKRMIELLESGSMSLILDGPMI